MKKAEKILDTLCVISTIIFFLAITLMVFAQGFAVITLNGALSTALSKSIAEPASMVSAVASIIAILLAYMRGQMKAD
ncbi:MAG: hypothetical protein E7L17_07260 [Clostridium sp.]|uniref:hypothetical protein n=1 Tax=Clostridium sp. TaxID=1506 RepID=UPI002907ED67|nr:hypothetical protein [Clostridium sp.]MDU7337894.1 hypothetical protein [Clostridium sp.]